MAAVILFFCPDPTEESRKYRRWIHASAISCMGITFILSLAALIHTLRGGLEGAAREYMNFSWSPLGDSAFQPGLLLDPLSGIMLTLFTLTGLCVFIFNPGYLKEKENLAGLYCRLMFCLGAGFTILISNSLFLFVVCGGWVCLGTYLLIEYNASKNPVLDTGRQAFIFNSIGDLCYIMGIFWLLRYSHTPLLYAGGSGCMEASALSSLGPTAGTGIAILFLIGTMAKSALFPLHVWMPDTSEATWPAATFIHLFSASIAGIYVLIRLAPLLAAANDAGCVTAYLLPCAGLLTLLLGTILASVQNDILRMLSYVTISQYGMILLALSLGGVTPAVVIFILTILLRAVLYLGTGSLIRGRENGNSDIREMGGLKEYMPWTFYIFTGGSIGISLIPVLIFCYPVQWGGVPPLFPGVLFILGLPGMFSLGFSQGRQIHYIFRGKYRMPVLKVKENKLDKLKAALNASDEPEEAVPAENNEEAGWWSVGSTIHLKQTKKTPKEPAKTNAPKESSVLMKSVMAAMAGIAVLWLPGSLFAYSSIGTALAGNPENGSLFHWSKLLTIPLTLAAIAAGWECARRLYRDHNPKKIRSEDPLAKKLPHDFYYHLKHDLRIDDFYRVTIQKPNRLLAKRINKFEEKVFQNTGFFIVPIFKVIHKIKMALPGKNKSLSLGILVFILLVIALATLNYFWQK